MPEFVSSSPFLVVAGVIVLLLLIAFVASRYHVAGANEALIVAGSRGAKVHDEKGQAVSARGDKGVKVVVGGGTFVFPLVNRVGRLKLTARQISVQRTFQSFDDYWSTVLGGASAGPKLAAMSSGDLALLKARLRA